MAGRTPRSYFQLRLRTLLVLCTLAGIAMGWWFMPFVREAHREDGSLRSRFELRRNWRGQVVSHGKQIWYSRDGKQALSQIDYGTPYDDADFTAVLNKGGDFDHLIWLITETLDPKTWTDPPFGRINVNTITDP
jgi:hypothetical protein